MVDLKKRSSLKIAALTAVAAAGFAFGVGANAAEPLKVAFAYSSPVGDAGWTAAHDRGRQAAVAKFGDKIVTQYVESVPESADAERVLRDLAAQGNKVIFGTSFGYMDFMLRVAKKTPKVQFQHCAGYKTAPNMSTYDIRTYEAAYLNGIIAGKMSKAGVVGMVASIPIPEVLRNIDAFTLGAQSINPKITTKVVWVNEWFNPPKETEAATSLINAVVDVLYHNTNSPAVLKTAQERGKRALGYNSDMSSFAPKAHLASSQINWAPYYIKTIQDVLDGKPVGNQMAWWGVKEGAIDIVSMADDIPADIKAKEAEVKAGLKDGSFKIWKGPILDNTGKVQIKAGEVADDKFLGGLMFYVAGVEGSIPGAK